MKSLFQNKYLWLVFATTGLIILLVFSCSQKKVDYLTAVKPIFNKKCIACHAN